MTHPRVSGNWRSQALKDMLGREFKLHDNFVKAIKSGHAVNLQICKVTRIEDGKIYANDSKVAIVYPGRCLILPHGVAP